MSRQRNADIQPNSLRDMRMRAVGEGVSGGCTVAGVIGMTAHYLGIAGLLCLAVVAGPGLLLASHMLERRASRGQKERE